jgi:hypothetical protein
MSSAGALPGADAVQSNAYLFRYLIIANILLYLEAGAVPALLLTLADEFGMDQSQQGVRPNPSTSPPPPANRCPPAPPRSSWEAWFI